MKTLFAFLIGSAMALALLLLIWHAVLHHWGTAGNLGRYLEGSNYLVFPTQIDVGDGTRGEKRTAAATVRNLSFSQVRVVGVVTTCNCLAATGLPLTIEPGESMQVALQIYLESASGRVEQLARIVIDDGRLRTTPVVITGNCASSKGVKR